MLGPPQSPQCSGMWSSQTLGGKPWRGLRGLSASHTQLRRHTPPRCGHTRGGGWVWAGSVPGLPRAWLSERLSSDLPRAEAARVRPDPSALPRGGSRASATRIRGLPRSGCRRAQVLGVLSWGAGGLDSRVSDGDPGSSAWGRAGLPSSPHSSGGSVGLPTSRVPSKWWMLQPQSAALGLRRARPQVPPTQRSWARAPGDSWRESVVPGPESSKQGCGTLGLQGPSGD